MWITNIITVWRLNYRVFNKALHVSCLIKVPIFIVACH